MDKKTDHKADERATSGPVSSGKTNLIIGGGIGAYGTTLALTVGYICPVCVVAAPAFLGVGAWQTLKARADKKSD